MTEAAPENTTPPSDVDVDLGATSTQGGTPPSDDDDDQVVDELAGVKLGDGISDDRATGKVAVFDTRLQRYVTGAHDSADDARSDGKVAGSVTKSGRFQLRRV